MLLFTNKSNLFKIDDIRFLNGVFMTISAITVQQEPKSAPGTNTQASSSTSQETAVALNSFRCASRPLLEIAGDPLPESLQHLVASYLCFFEEVWTDHPYITELCRRTEMAYFRHLEGVCLMRYRFASTLILDKQGEGSSALRTIFPLSQEVVIPIWENRQAIEVANFSGNDEDFEKLVSPLAAVEKITFRSAANLCTLQGLSRLTSLKELVIDEMFSLRTAVENGDEAERVLRQIHGDQAFEDWKGRTPFDLAALDLPKLEKFTIRIGSLFGTLDARKCLNLKELAVAADHPRYQVPLKIDVRGLSCKVVMQHPSDDVTVLTTDEQGREIVTRITDFSDKQESCLSSIKPSKEKAAKANSLSLI